MNGDLALAEENCREAARRIPAFGGFSSYHNLPWAKKKDPALRARVGSGS
jgi:hypothetical protein